MANLSINLCGVQFKNPVIAASGTYGFGREFNELYDVGQIGGVSTKGLTLEPRLGNPVPRIAESRGVILNAVGLQNPGVDPFRRHRFCQGSRGAPGDRRPAGGLLSGRDHRGGAAFRQGIAPHQPARCA